MKLILFVGLCVLGMAAGQVSPMAAGSESNFVIRDGALWASGLNNYGQLGDGSKTDKSAFVKVVTDGVQAVSSAGYYTLILKKDGTVWGTGWNGNGCLGDGTSVDKTRFVKSVEGSSVKTVVARWYNSFLLKQDGSVWVTGTNGYGEFGDGTNTGSNTFKKVISSGVQSLSGGTHHLMAVKEDGSLWITGEFNRANSKTFKQVISSGVQAVSSWGYHSFVLKQDGSLWGNGRGTSGQLGDNSNDVKVGFVKVVDGGVKAVSAGGSHSLMLKQDGSLWATGNNDVGQLGDGSTTSRSTFAKVMSGGVEAFSAGGDNSMVLKADGSVWATGGNGKGQLGDESKTNRASFKQITNFPAKATTTVATTTPAAPTTAEPTTAAPTTAATTTTCQPSDCADESLVPKDNLATIKCKGASCTPTECCVCGLRHWGFDIPFAKNKGITVTGDDLSSGKLQMTFSLETQACVDRASQLSLSFRDTEAPVCQGKLASDNVACASKAAGGKSGCEQDGKCRYRVTCKKDDLVLTDVFDVRKSLAAGSQKRTDYVIDIRTNLLASKGKDIYTAPSASNPVTTLEVCVRPTVKRTGNTEVLFREVVALVEMDTTGGFSLTIEADSRDDALKKSVDLDVDADAFACEKKGVAYERASPKALTPNSLLTLCVVGKMSSFKCNNIAELTFEQTTGMSKYSEIRVSGYQARDLTNKYPNVDVKTSSSTTVKGCVVDARLGSVFFAGLNPANVVVSGKALLDFVPTGGRKLRGQSSESAAVMVRFGDRKLQDQEVDEGEISSFGAEFELSNSNNDDVDFATMPIQGIAAGCVAVTTMLFTV